ncbi:nucleolar pre-ribosomal-associated protein 1 [Mactra antiquata]
MKASAYTSCDDKMAAPKQQARVYQKKSEKPVKRKGDIVSEPVNKKKKENPYTEIEFKFHLKDASTVYLGLEKFLETATDWSNGNRDVEDIVLGYCRSSPECEEILKELMGSSRKQSELQLIFGCLEKILIRIADDLTDKFYSTGQTIVKKLLANHVQAMYSTLDVKNRSIQIKTTLKLLIAMIMLGQKSAKLVLQNVDFSQKVFTPLFQRRDVKDKEDVRTCMTHLLLACILAGDYEVITKLIQTRGVFENLFTGMEYDRIDTLQLVLTTLLEKVILNNGISKTAKVKMFSETGLRELGRLYNWQGLGKWKQSIKNKGKHFKHKGKHDMPTVEDTNSQSNEDQIFVGEIIDKFLMEVCTSYKHGIIFHDKTFGMSGRSQNRLMTSLLRSLSGQLSHILVEKLVVSILTACPDQLQYFLPNILHSLSPREATKWISTMNFLMKVYNSLEKNITVLKWKEMKPVSEMVQILCIYTLPPLQILNTVLPGLKEKSMVVNHQVTCLIRQLADNAVYILESLSSLTMYTSEMIAEIYRLYKAFVLKSLPDVVLISKCFEKALTLQKSQSDEINKLQDLCNVSITDVLVEVEKVLCLYQKLQPSLLDDYPLILGKLLEGIMGNDTESRSSSSEVFVLKLLAGTEAKRLPWGKKNSSGHTLLYQLLKMLTFSDDHMTDVTIHLFCKLLLGTGQFESHEGDLQIWLQTLKSCDHKVLDFVCSALMTYIHNPFPYMDRMSDLDTDVTMETTTTTSIKVHNMNDILMMDIGDLDDCVDSDNDTAVNKRFPFSPLMLVAMETLDKMENISEDIKTYISRVTLCIFYQQTDPVPLCCLLSRFRNDLLLPKLYDYILTWKMVDTQETDVELSSARYEDFISSNDGFTIDDADSTRNLHKQLIDLNYFTRLSMKVTDKKLLKRIKSGKKNILKCCHEVQEQKHDVLSKSVSSDMDLLLPEKVDPLTSCLRLVLNNPVIKHYFLLEKSDDQSEKVSGILTELVKDILRMVLQLDGDLNELIEFYYLRVVENLRKVISGADVTNVKVIYKISLFLVPNLADEQCREMFDLTLNTENENSTEFSKHLVPLVLLMLECLIKSKFRSVKLTGLGMDRLVSCVVNEENSNGIMTSFFKKFPELSVQCSENVVETLLAADMCSLVEHLMENSSIVACKVGTMIRSGDLDLTSESHLRLVHCYLKMTLWKTNKLEVETKTYSKIQKHLKSSITSLCSNDDIEHVDLLYKITEILVEGKVIDAKIISKAQKRLNSVLDDGKSLKLRHVDMLRLLYKGDNKDLLIQKSVDCMITVLPLDEGEIIDKLLEIVSQCSQEEVETLISSWTDPSNVWSKLAENIVNFAYTKPSAIEFLTLMLPTIYQKDDLDPGLTLNKLFDLVKENSSFLPVMYGEIGTEIKDVLVHLLLCIIEKCPQVCHTEHISIYLGAYNASLTITDQNLLKILHLYEQNEIQFTNYRPFLWGSTAIEHYSLPNSTVQTLKGITSKQVVENIDFKLMAHSILKFPLRRKLQATDPEPAENYKSDDSCYDPCFMLPLLSQLAQPECYIDCRRFTERGCLGYILASLSSHDENIRTVAVHILKNVQGHLETARLKEREELKYFVDFVMRSLPENNKLSSIITQFLARTSKLLLKLDDYMYSIVLNFLFVKPTLDIKNIPDFYKMFNSTAFQYRTERSWMLSLMHDGMRESSDYWIFEKRFIYKLLQTFYLSHMADVQSQLQVLNILTATCSERRLALDLYQNHSFLIWIATAIKKLSGSQQTQLTESICKLLHILWCAVVDNKQIDDDKLQLSFSIEMLTCLKSLLLHMRDVSDDTKLDYVKTLSGTVKHIQSMTGSLRGHVSQTVSPSDIMLLLLHCQNNWTQSKSVTQQIKNVLKSLGMQSSVLKCLDSQPKRKQDVVSSQDDMELGQDVTLVPSAEESVKSNVQNQIAEEVFNIIDVWTMNSHVADESIATDVVILRWLLDHVKLAADVNNVLRTITVVCKILQPDFEMLESKGLATNCACFIACEGSTVSHVILVDVLNLYTLLTERYCRLGIVEQQKLEIERSHVEKLLNKTLYEYLQLSSKLKKGAESGGLMMNYDDENTSEDMKSTHILQTFISQL